MDLAFPSSLKVLAASEHVAQDRSRRRRRDRLPAAPPRPRRRGEGVRCVQGHSQDAPPQTQRHEAHRQWRPLRQGVSDDGEGQFLFRTRGAPRFPLEKSGEARAKSGVPCGLPWASAVLEGDGFPAAAASRRAPDHSRSGAPRRQPPKTYDAMNGQKSRSAERQTRFLNP